MRAVQDDDMIGIDDILEMLQPVAGHDLRASAADAAVVGIDEFARVEDFQALVARQHRLLPGWAHISEDQPIKFLHGIPRLAHAVAEQAAFGFAGLLQAATFDVEQPAMIAAADAALLDLAVIERGAAMRAAGLYQSRAAGLVAKQDQVFPEHTDLAWRLRGMRAQSDGMPIAAQQVAHRRARTDLGQRLDVGRRRPAKAGANVTGVARRRFHPVTPFIGGVILNTLIICLAAVNAWPRAGGWRRGSRKENPGSAE
jgi:hypothetical protein